MQVLDKRYKKNPDIVFRKIAEESILVPISNNVGDLQSIYTLNEVASRIWELIDPEISLTRIRDKLAEEFDVSVKEAEQDLKEFLDNLLRIKGIEEV
ncbi:MAG: PqqD family protein [Candidatus Omnitrophica bacterium]|nr:PqqD family protein [Candidatus Omnitrophota bacterium]